MVSIAVCGLAWNTENVCKSLLWQSWLNNKHTHTHTHTHTYTHAHTFDF